MEKNWQNNNGNQKTITITMFSNFSIKITRQRLAMLDRQAFHQVSKKGILWNLKQDKVIEKFDREYEWNDIFFLLPQQPRLTMQFSVVRDSAVEVLNTLMSNKSKLTYWLNLCGKGVDVNHWGTILCVWTRIVTNKLYDHNVLMYQFMFQSISMLC